VDSERIRDVRILGGLISGTSIDGIDAALVRVSGPATSPSVRLLAFETTAYSPPIRQAIMRIAAGEAATAGEISQLNFLLGELFARAALSICKKARVAPSRVTAIASHGQTIYHQGAPTRESGYRVASTLQIAEPSVIAARTGVPVVADFRTADMAAGGQGAPLVPLVDYLLLRHARQGTVALNIGGIGNFTVIPAGANPSDVFGFDTGPGNMVIDGVVRHFTKGQKSYDAGGRWAAKGRVLEPLLEELLRLPFFSHPPPKSAGREQFGRQFMERFFIGNKKTGGGGRSRVTCSAAGSVSSAFPLYVAERGSRPEDLLRTATELTSRTIADALTRFVTGKTAIDRLIVSGGGAHNRLLMRRLGELLPSLHVQRSDELGLDVDAKEAIAFAILADRTLHGLPGNLPSVTGARSAVVLGTVSRPG
jgi:anhydro-N-acetylmuramic acid kinase